MKIVIIGGFLGSGKTTTILKLSEELSKKDQKVAILVNEVGQIGVDGDTISSSGLITKELTSGCVCCSISTGLQQTLKAIKQDFDPDIVLIEPTGIAFPAQIKDNIKDMSIDKLSFAPIICLIDGKRFLNEFDQIPRFVVNQVAEAEVIGINKIDITPNDRLPEVVTRLSEINETATYIKYSAKEKDENFYALFDQIYNTTNEIKMVDQRIKKEMNSVEMSTVSTYSAEYSLDMENIDLNTYQAISERIVNEVKMKVLKKSSYFIGHLKAILYLSGHMVKTSITSFEESPDSSKYEIEDKDKTGLKILTAVTGIENSEIQAIVDETVTEVFDLENISVYKVESNINNNIIDLV